MSETTMNLAAHFEDASQSQADREASATTAWRLRTLGHWLCDPLIRAMMLTDDARSDARPPSPSRPARVRR